MSKQSGDSLYSEDYRPTFSDLKGGSIYSSIANANWLRRDGPASFSANTVKEIYKALEQESFALKSVLLLENLQYVERYLWPNYNEDSPDELVISLAMITAVKRRENIQFWGKLWLFWYPRLYLLSTNVTFRLALGLFETGLASFPSLFRRVLILLLSVNLPTAPKVHLLAFVTSAFQSLDSPFVRKECAPLVSIGIWQHFHSEIAIDTRLREKPQFKKAWRAATKKLALADQKLRARLNFERSWLYLIVLDFISVLFTDTHTPAVPTLYAEQMVEFLTDLLSQLPTRRYVHSLLEDLQILPCIRLSPLFALHRNRLFRDLVGLFEHFYYFQDGEEHSPDHHSIVPDLRHRNEIARLQKESLHVSKKKLMILGLANYASVSQRDDLTSHLSLLDDTELGQLAHRLGLRQSYPDGVPCPVDRKFTLCSIVETFIQRPTATDIVKSSHLLPTEGTLFDKMIAPDKFDKYYGSRPLAIPKLNLQYLSSTDFLWRMFSLCRAELFFEIQRDIQETIRKLKPSQHNGTVTFGGASKMAVRINRISILDVAPALVGETCPAFVRAELDLLFDNMTADVRREWDSLKPNDVVFLLSIHPREGSGGSTSYSRFEMAEKTCIRLLRCAEVVQNQTDNRQSAVQPQVNDRRKLHVRLDRAMYQVDTHGPAALQGVYESLNLVVRRRAAENNFRPLLASIQSLIQEPGDSIPGWFKDTFLGCGDPTEACFPKLEPLPKSVNFGDTFLDTSHLRETLNNKQLNISIPSTDLKSPFTLTLMDTSNTPSGTVLETSNESKLVYSVSSSKPTAREDSSNQKSHKERVIKYTEAQVEAVFSGTNPGLSLVVGPPGTGKTDVATQIICNLYHNFPNERTLLIAHSNQALNQLFSKIASRDIDERHLLRLGHGEDDIQPASGHIKYGRIEFLMERRQRLLEEVDRLALSINAPGAHGNSCETASYFYKVYIKPMWQKFQDLVSASSDIEILSTKFPFSDYFLITSEPLWPRGGTFSSALHTAESRFEQISKIFTELNDIMPFELLRSARDKTGYLLSTEARVIAMTSTYAAIKRDEIVRQGFRYDNIVMEEAAQITEIQTFIPLTLQKSTNTATQIKRIVLCGDHLQNSPVIQNTALRYFANLEQSLFARLVRLDVPTIKLDKQGRARPSIASLYSWRYPGLGNLDYFSQKEMFLHANAGFRHEFQFINVDDFQGRGEQEPSAHFLQNLGEAEYVVALFQYMRLLGYPADRISILSSYSGQRALIQDILNRRCSKNPLFGYPAHLTTIDRFQGEQNDCSFKTQP
ncbi:hypothetical protein DRE_06937 [Drechslerella stenobrocha 248]|uniref:Pre-mRNA-splicing factor n=1 Tax=Drechslerella stenobrocha 248 TaxID=1043628 RepID=W7HVV4_9PEZI|nr:hypothetical protein DRE_06937 [Drechslerella stenobrocha 248]